MRAKKVPDEDCDCFDKVCRTPVTTLRDSNGYGFRQTLKSPCTGVVALAYSLFREAEFLSMSASALSDRDFAQVRAVQKASAFALSKSSEAGRTLNVCIGRFVSGFATAHAQGRRSNSVPDWATLASFVLAAFLPATPDLARSRRNFNFKRQFDTIRGLEKIVAGAAGQLFENAQDKSMSELCVPDPFGQARRS